MDMDRQRITTKGPVVEEADVSIPRRLKVLIAIVLLVFVPVGIVLLSQGISGMGVQEGPTFETTAVVSDMETKRRHGDRYSYTVYYVYLDFSNSQMDPEIVDLLVQHQQGIMVRSRDVFNCFYVRKHVSVVYHILGAGYTRGSVAIESVDGHEPQEGIGDLTTPGYEKGENIAVIAIGGFLLALGLVFLVLVLHPRIRGKVWPALSRHTN